MALPNFIVIGAAKAGTTSLHGYLSNHPDVFMPPQKELDFFVAEHNWSNGLDWYERCFKGCGSATAVGEASPRYTSYPLFSDVPKRMAQILPEAKLIYVVRNPIERMISHYQHLARRGSARDDLERALLEDPIPLALSSYAMQLDRFREYFSKEQILVVLSEQLRNDREHALKRVFDFLGVDPDWCPNNVVEEYNVSVSKRGPRRLTRKLTAISGWDRLAASIPESAKSAARMLTHRPLGHLELSAEVRCELEARLRDDVVKLRKYCPPDFDGWGIA